MNPAVLAVLLFTIGLVGIVVRKNILVILLCFELQLNAVSLLFVHFGSVKGSPIGQVAVLLIILTAACEVALGLAIALYAYREKKEINLDTFSEMKW